MYLLASLRPAPRIDAPAGFIARALDAGVAEPARVAAIRALHGVGSDMLATVARALVPILNEPLWWLPSEVLSLLAIARPLVHIGVVDGRFVPSRTEPHNLIGDGECQQHCASIGRVLLPHNIRWHADRVPRLPWLTGARGDL